MNYFDRIDMLGRLLIITTNERVKALYKKQIFSTIINAQKKAPKESA